jgi:hypothetical protein
MASTTIDWPAVLTELAYILGDTDESHPDSRVPCGTRVLAQHLGVHRESIRRWHDGSEPGHADGEMLLTRWQLLTGKAREFAPRTRLVLSAARMR